MCYLMLQVHCLMIINWEHNYTVNFCLWQSSVLLYQKYMTNNDKYTYGQPKCRSLNGEWVESWSSAMDLDQGWNFPFILTSQGNYFIQFYLQLPTIYSIVYFMCVWHSHILSRFMAAQPYNGHTEQLWVTDRGDPIIGID